MRSLILLLAAVLVNSLYFPTTYAAALTSMSDTMTRLDAATPSNHTIKFTTPTGVTAAQNITVTFPAGFTIGSVAFADIDFSYGVSTGAETEATLAATPAAATWGAVFSGQVLTITSGTGTIAAGYKVIVEIGTNATAGASGVNQIVNHSTPATYLITLGGTMADTGKLATVIISNDQVSVTAAVDPSLSFSLSANSSAFGTMTTGAIATGGTNVVLTIGTNANAGYTITVKDLGSGAADGFYNAGTGTIIPSASATLVAGTEGYGIQATMSGAGSITAPYNVTGNVVGALQLTPQSLASYATSTSSNHTVTVVHKAAISTSSKPGNYSDTLTYIATSNF